MDNIILIGMPGSGKKGHSEFQFPGLCPAVFPAPGGDGCQQPALGGHLGKVGGEPGPVQKVVEGDPFPFGVFHGQMPPSTVKRS